MSKYIFKTTLSCGSCVDRVSKFLNEEAKIKSWEADMDDPNKTVTVEADEDVTQLVPMLLMKAGYRSELLEKQD